MGRMNFVISDPTEKRFREGVARHGGVRKGNISRALEEAIDLWIKREEDPAIVHPRQAFVLRQFRY